MATPPCNNQIGGFTAAWEIIPDQFDWFTDLANTYIQQANAFTQELANYTIEPIQLQAANFNPNTNYAEFVLPEEPDDFIEPVKQFTGEQPVAPNTPDIDTSGLNSIEADFGNVPNEPYIRIPAAPIVNLPTIPTGPAITLPDVPVYDGSPLPDVPLLEDINLPDIIEVEFADFDVARPDYIQPEPLTDEYLAELDSRFAGDYSSWKGEADALGATQFRDVLRTILSDGGQSLPGDVERELFNQAVSDTDRQSAQAVAQAEQEWAGRGFDLPGTTLLARVQEAREENRRQRGAAQRQLHTTFYEQQIQSLRWGVERGIQLEGQIATIYADIYNLTKSYVDFHWGVIKDVYQSKIDLIRLQYDIYKTDVEVYKIGIETELAKLEVYKTQIEAQKLIGDINQQYVDIYRTELEAVKISVDVFKAEVDAVNAQIGAELAKVEVYKAEVDGYTATINGERAKYEIYDSQITAEETKVKVYSAQVDAYGKRIDAYRTEVQAETAKITAETDVAQALSSIYNTEVSAWSEGIKADTANLASFVEVYRANLQKYTALLSAEQYRVQGESRNTQLDIESEKARVAALLKQADQSIEQLKHVTTLGLSATEQAAKVNAQLAASSMSAINVSAGMTSSNSISAADNVSCTTNFSGVVA